jgi:hypothetical protein
MQAVGSSKMLVTTNKTTQCPYPEDDTFLTCSLCSQLVLLCTECCSFHSIFMAYSLHCCSADTMQGTQHCLLESNNLFSALQSDLCTSSMYIFFIYLYI